MREQDVLELQRGEKIKLLGILCYNAAVDGKEVPDAVADNLIEVKNRFKQLSDAQSRQTSEDAAARCGKELDRSLMSTGYMCYNSFVDGRVRNPELVSLCREIAEIGKNVPTTETASVSNFDNLSQDAQRDEALSVTVKQPSAEAEDFRMNYPFGMEPIPSDYILCKCGYRNKSFANFCGKCGTRLEGAKHGKLA